MLVRRLLYRTSTEGGNKFSLRTQYEKLLRLTRPEKGKYLKNLALTLAHASIFMYLPKIYGDISHLMALKEGIQPTAEILQTYAYSLGKWATLFGAAGLLTYQRRYEFLDISNRLAMRMRNALYKETLDSNIYRRSNSSQQYLYHLTTDIKTVSEFLGETVFHGFRGILFLVGGSACLIYTSPLLSVLAVIIMACLNLIFRSKNLKLKQLKAQENSQLGHLNTYASERFANSKLIKISNTQNYEEVSYLKQLDNLYKLSTQVAKANGLNYGMLEGVGLFALFAVAATGSLLISFNITQFNLLASSTYALYVALGFRSVMNFNTEMLKAMAVYSTFEQKIGDLTTNPQYTGTLPIHAIRSKEQLLQDKWAHTKVNHLDSIRIRYENVRFKYKPESNSGLKNFNLTIEPGKMTAIIGRSGIGKTTMLNLLVKLFEPESGRIFFNNEPLDQKSDEFIQQNISYVTQDSFVFSGSFYSNIVYGNQGFDVSEERVVEALKAVEAYDFVMRKGGLHGLVRQKATNLSGGEKQKLVLARAILKRPAILILDEATANVDKESEEKIFHNLKELFRNSTCIVISHKLGLIEKYIDDKIDFEKLNE